LLVQTRGPNRESISRKGRGGHLVGKQRMGNIANNRKSNLTEDMPPDRLYVEGAGTLTHVASGTS